MLHIQLRTKRDPASVKAMVGRLAEPSDFGVLLTEDGTVFKPDGKRLVTLIRGGMSPWAADAAYPFLHWLRRHKTTNRGNYAGDVRQHKVKEDGSLSKTSYATAVRSSVAGAFDRYPRFPFCRETAVSTEKPEEWGACFPAIQEVARIFERHAPDRYRAQEAVAKQTHPAYVIPDTPFTTLTVNNCVAGAFHTDAGDYEPGFGCIAVLRRGHYSGCHLGFPAYGVAVDLQDRDVILFDPHEVHGNTPFRDAVGVEGVDWERISVVFYYRQKMVDCLSPAEELARAKQLRGALEMPTLDNEDAGEAQ